MAPATPKTAHASVPTVGRDLSARIGPVLSLERTGCTASTAPCPASVTLTTLRCKIPRMTVVHLTSSDVTRGPVSASVSLDSLEVTVTAPAPSTPSGDPVKKCAPAGMMPTASQRTAPAPAAPAGWESCAMSSASRAGTARTAATSVDVLTERRVTRSLASVTVLLAGVASSVTRSVRRANMARIV